MKRILVIGIFLVCLCGLAFAQFHSPQIAPEESGFQQIQYIDTGEVLYNMRWKTKSVEQNGKQSIFYTMTGDNNKQGTARIDWTEEAVFLMTPSGMQTQYWKKNSTGAEQMSWSMNYNWTSRQIQFAFEDRLAKKKESKVIKIENNAIPGDCMNFILRGFPFEKGPGTKLTGQIINSDGSSISGHIIYIGEEKLNTAFGTIDTYKLELKPAGALGLVAPDMFMWFTKTAPHVWLRFDGRDDGFTKPRTKNVLLNYQPKNWIAR